MKLRGKTILIVSVTLVCLIGILYTVSRQVLMAGFSNVERENTVRNVERTLDAYAENWNNLGVKVADWARWDDTYRFIAVQNREYIESNLNDGSIGDLKLSYMFFVNDTGAIVFCRGYDPEKEAGYDPSPGLKHFIRSDSALVHHREAESVTAGIVLSPDGPLLVASRPITTSEGKGPIRGAVIFGRYLDAAEIERMAQITHLSTTVVTVDHDSMPDDMARMSAHLSGVDRIRVSPLSADSIAGYSVITDIHGNPALLLRVTIGRDIYKQGQLTMLYLVAAILIAGLIFGAIILGLLERLVLSRVAKLSGDVAAIGSSGDHSKRVGVGGSDELADLAASLNDMLGALQRTEQAVRERNEQMRLIMNTVPSGLLSLDERHTINPEYSRSAETILNKTGLAGMNFFDALGLTADRADDRTKLQDFLDLLGQELLSEKEMAGLNPFEEYPLPPVGDAAVRWLRLRYFLIRRGVDVPRHVLVVIEDITEEKALAEKVRQSERENLQLKAIVEDPDLFRDFLAETRAILAHAEERVQNIATAENRKVLINELFRDVHTIKGTASSFRLGSIAEIAGQLEDTLSPLRESDDITIDAIAATRSSLTLLTRAVMDAVESARAIMGDDIGDSGDMHLKIALSRLKRENAAIDELLRRALIGTDVADRLRREIDRQLGSLRLIPAQRGLAKALKIVPGLISRLQKEIRFTVEGGDEPIDCEIARELCVPLVHLIRNAFDHGIETSPDERVALGKPEYGNVTLKIAHAGDDRLVVTLSDDGRGIDPDLVKSIAIRKGLLSKERASTLTPSQVLELIYLPGFTTATSVSEVSGRGVGMDAVLVSIRDYLGGTISIESQKTKGTTFTMTIPCLR